MPDSEPTRPSRATLWVCWGCLAGLFVWIFADVLFAANNFVYRDAAHFYYPLYKFIAGEWAAGRVPLWNAYENLGVPLAAMGTSSVFYPGKLVFALPVSYDVAFKAYILGHLLLAAGGSYWLARRWGHSIEAAALCGLAYAFGGNVLVQYCNVVFLVSAAWLPLAIAHVHRLLHETRFASALWLGLVLAMMVLGGDPQMAYHVGLIAAGYALLLWRADRRQTQPELRPGRLVGKRLTLLIVAAAVGFALAAVQIFSTLELSTRSHRAAHERPRSVYELATDVARGDPGSLDGLLGKATSEHAHESHLYEFSVGPWRLAEFVWPNVTGRQFPVHRRWLAVIPAERRVWAPSLYLGILPLVLALAAWRMRRGEVRTRWLSWTVLLAVLASFGVYGLGWVYREIAVHWDPRLEKPANAPFGDAFGGLYWLMVVWLPGYVGFRYPAKLLVLAAMGLSLLSARGWDELRCDGNTRRARRWLLVFGWMSAVGAVAALAIRPYWSNWFSGVPANPLFGPLDPAGAWGDLFFALLQTAILCYVGSWIVRAREEQRRPWPAMLLVGITALDVAVANGWMVVSAPAEHWRAESKLGEAMRAHQQSAGNQPYRVDRPMVWWPKSWRSTLSDERQREGLVWDRDTLMSKYPLNDSVAVLRAPDTMAVNDFHVFLSRMSRWQPGGLHRTLNDLNVKYLVLPVGQQPPDRESWRPLSVVNVGDEKAARLWVHRSPLPRAWIVRDVDVLPPLTSPRPAEVIRRTDEVLFADGKPRDLSRSAVLETDHPLGSAVTPPRGGLPPVDRCTLEHYSPNRVEIDVHVDGTSGLLILSDLYYPGWTAEVHTPSKEQTRPTPILRTNRIMRGVVLPPGRHRVIFRYQPPSILFGGVVSGIGVTLLLLVGGVLWWRRVHPTRRAGPA